MTELLPVVGQHHQARTLTHLDHANKTAIVQPFEPASRQGPMTQRKVRNVCGRCNNGWMSRVVQRAKPIATLLIRGGTAELSVAHQNELASWIAIATI